MPPDQNLTTDHESRISTVEAGLDAMRAQIAGFAQDIRAIGSDIQTWRRDESTARRPQYGVLAGVLVAAGLAVISFATLITAPQTKNIDTLAKAISQMRDDDRTLLAAQVPLAEFDGKMRSKIDSLEPWLEKTSIKQVEDGERIAYLEGLVEAIEKQLNAVDYGGSRRWIGAQKPDGPDN